jgi:hypothetical protein
LRMWLTAGHVLLLRKGVAHASHTDFFTYMGAPACSTVAGEAEGI